jgi:hypothetical protein
LGGGVFFTKKDLTLREAKGIHTVAGQILDVANYDSRIRPSASNSSGKHFKYYNM